MDIIHEYGCWSHGYQSKTQGTVKDLASPGPVAFPAAASYSPTLVITTNYIVDAKDAPCKPQLHPKRKRQGKAVRYVGHVPGTR